jgi:hypothetical protein
MRQFLKTRHVSVLDAKIMEAVISKNSLAVMCVQHVAGALAGKSTFSEKC